MLEYGLLLHLKLLLHHKYVEGVGQVVGAACHQLPADLLRLEVGVFLVLGSSLHEVVPVLPGLVHLHVICNYTIGMNCTKGVSSRTVQLQMTWLQREYGRQHKS